MLSARVGRRASRATCASRLSRAGYAGRAGAARPRAGVTLVELLVALVLTGIVVGALLRSRSASHEVARDALARGEARRQLRAGMGAVLATLRGASPAGGDLLALADTALELHVTLGATAWCASAPAMPDVPPTATILAPTGADVAAWLDAPAPGDALLVLVHDPPADTSVSPGTAWRWQRVMVAAAGIPGRSTCMGGEHRATLRVPLVGAPWLTPPAGSPARLLRRARWSVYRSRGRHYLGWRDAAAGGAALDVVQPVSGPHDVRDIAGERHAGVTFAFLDTAGAPATRAARVATIRVRAWTTTEGTVVGAESLVVAAALRNGSLHAAP
jgi:hypothetical protein